MNEAVQIVAEDDPLLTSDFVQEMVKQMRAIDTYGLFDSQSAAQMLDPFILTKERKREIPIIGDPDESVITRLKAFYNVIATLIEQDCGLLAAPVINLSYEGFGRALIIVGRLVVMDRSLRDVHRFGFPSLAKLKEEADKLVNAACMLIAAHRQVAEL
jgi:probable nitrogen fixation protein